MGLFLEHLCPVNVGLDKATVVPNSQINFLYGQFCKDVSAGDLEAHELNT